MTSQVCRSLVLTSLKPAQSRKPPELMQVLICSDYLQLHRTCSSSDGGLIVTVWGGGWSAVVLFLPLQSRGLPTLQSLMRCLHGLGVGTRAHMLLCKMTGTCFVFLLLLSGFSAEIRVCGLQRPAASWEVLAMTLAIGQSVKASWERRQTLLKPMWARSFLSLAHEHSSFCLAFNEFWWCCFPSNVYGGSDL